MPRATARAAGAAHRLFDAAANAACQRDCLQDASHEAQEAEWSMKRARPEGRGDSNLNNGVAYNI